MSDDKHIEFETETGSGSPDVPTDLLELHLVLEEKKVSPEEFKEVFGSEADNQS